MGDFSYWMTVLRTAGLFVAWTFICAILVAVVEFVLRKAFGRRTSV